jgi:hypothetical protein
LLQLHYLAPLSKRAVTEKCSHPGCRREFLSGSLAVHVRAIHETPKALSAAEEEAQRRKLFASRAAQEKADFELQSRDPVFWNQLLEEKAARLAHGYEGKPDPANVRHAEYLNRQLEESIRDEAERRARVEEEVKRRWNL